MHEIERNSGATVNKSFSDGSLQIIGCAFVSIKSAKKALPSFEVKNFSREEIEKDIEERNIFMINHTIRSQVIPDDLIPCLVGKVEFLDLLRFQSVPEDLILENIDELNYGGKAYLLYLLRQDITDKRLLSMRDEVINSNLGGEKFWKKDNETLLNDLQKSWSLYYFPEINAGDDNILVYHKAPNPSYYFEYNASFDSNIGLDFSLDMMNWGVSGKHYCSYLDLRLLSIGIIKLLTKPMKLIYGKRCGVVK